MDRRVDGLGTASVVRNPEVGTREELRFPDFPPGDRLPIVTVRIQTRAVGGDPTTINDSTVAIVNQGAELAYALARERSRRVGGIHPGDRVTVWLEVAAFDRHSPAIILARDVLYTDLIPAVEEHLAGIAEYEAGRLQGYFEGDMEEYRDLTDLLDGLGFDRAGFAGLDRAGRGAYLTDFMQENAEEIDDVATAVVDRQLGWHQIRRYLNIARMDVYYMFLLMPGPRRPPRGWKDGVKGMSDNQLYRIGGIIPKEVTEGNGLCLFLAVEYSTTFIYDRINKEVEKIEIDIPVALRTWQEPVARLGELRDEWGLTKDSELQVQLNALSIFHNAIIHVFDYDSGGSEVAYSTEEICIGQKEAHIVIMVMGGHAYPITKPHFLVQSTARHLFCPVCFHCFSCKRDLFYHIGRCSRQDPMDSIDYDVRRKFEKRSFMGLHFAVKGIRFRRCMNCRCLGVDNGLGVDLGADVGMYCQCERKLWLRGSSTQILRCMRCQVAFPIHRQSSHQCRMRVKEDQDQDMSNFWVYDIESSLDTVIEDPSTVLLAEMEEEEWSLEAAFESFRTFRQRHTANLIVMMSLEAGEIFAFKTIPEFMDYIFENKRFEGARFYAHNAGRYDTHFIVSELLARGCVPEFMPGSASGYTNMLMVSFEKRSFMDSYRLFPQGLGALAKSFDLPMTKGRFPYRFNRLENKDYVGILPTLEWFDPWDTRGGNGAMANLLEWHKEESLKYQAGTWNLENQLFEYCLEDVKILREVMMLGSKLFRDIFRRSSRAFPHWQPPMINITSHLTLTSAVVGGCLYGMRDKCRISLRDVDNVYVDGDRFYDMVLAYEHYFRGVGLHIVPEIKDHSAGLLQGYETEEGKVRVYVDCFRVGCPTCYPTQKLVVPPNHRSFASYREEYEDIRDQLWTLVGLARPEDLTCIWTHEYQQMFKDVPHDEQGFLHSVIDPYWPIDAREAMFGGHTEAGALFAKSYGRHKICKIDVNSMYPFVCAELELPFGDPITLRMDEVDRGVFDRREYFGLVRARFCPPKDLLFPILPRKVGNPGKLVFDCEERIGTYTTVDVYHALDLGYRVEEIYEIRHFPPSQRMKGLFKEYVYILFDVKAQAKLDEDSALYLLCKFALNSLWGKFGEKVHTSYTGFVSSLRGYMDFMNADTIKDGTREFMEVSDDVYLVKADYEKVVCDAPRFHHPELACFVLAHARKILHSAIYNLGPGRFLYCDTDSIIYLHTEGQTTPPIGSALGEWDVEVVGWPERYIERFYSCGPKAYCEVYSDGTHKVCYKGVMGSCRNKTLLGPEKFHELVQDHLSHQSMESGSGMTLSTQDFSISVNYSPVHGVNVRSDYRVKKIRVVNEKRFVPDFFGPGDDIEQYVIIRTLPYGFEGDVIEASYVTEEVFSQNFQY